MNDRIFVLGLGNVLCGDDGFGVHACRQLGQSFSFPDNCQIVDGGAQGQILYGIVTEADKLLIIDAANLGIPPGSLTVRHGSDIPAWLSSCKLSAHQASFAEVLALAKLKGHMPPVMALIGFQPVQMEFGGQLGQAARQALPQALDWTLDILRSWQIEPMPDQKMDYGMVSEVINAFY